MSQTYLGRYAAPQKMNVVAAVLNFTEEEWESLKKLKEEDAAEMDKRVVMDNHENNTGALGTEKGTTGSEYNQALFYILVVEKSLLACVNHSIYLDQNYVLAQTKHRQRCPCCAGEGAGAPSLGAAMPQAMLQAKAIGNHG